MKKINRVIWGLILVAAGVIFALNALGVTDVDLFFDGWWTLFIIVPCATGLFTKKDKSGNLIGLLIGVLLLLCSRDVLDFSILWKLMLPAIIVVIGLKLIFSGLFRKKEGACTVTAVNSDGVPTLGCAVFSGCEVNYDGKVFEGAKLVAVFGGVECDLRGAIIEKDCVIEVAAVFGGIDILVPKNVKIQTNTVSLFGSVDDMTRPDPDGPTLYIKGACVFGGTDIK